MGRLSNSEFKSQGIGRIEQLSTNAEFNKQKNEYYKRIRNAEIITKAQEESAKYAKQAQKWEAISTLWGAKPLLKQMVGGTYAPIAEAVTGLPRKLMGKEPLEKVSVFGEEFRTPSGAGKEAGRAFAKGEYQKGIGIMSSSALDVITLGVAGPVKLGLKLASKLGATGLKKATIVSGVTGAPVGAGYGFSGAMEQEASAGDVAKNALFGGALGTGIGVGGTVLGKSLSTGVSKIFADKTKQAISAIENELQIKVPEDKKIAIQSKIEEGISPEEIAQAVKEQNRKNIIEAVTELNDPEQIAPLLKGKIAEEDIPAVSRLLKNVENAESINSILKKYDPEIQNAKLVEDISFSETPEQVSRLLKGKADDKTIQEISPVLSSISDEGDIKRILDDYNVKAKTLETKIDEVAKKVESAKTTAKAVEPEVKETPTTKETPIQAQEVKTPQKPSEALDPLIQEAKKYKSAEEFVKAQGDEVYHGTSKDFTEFKKVTKAGVEKTPTEQPIFISRGKESPTAFAGPNGKVIDAVISKDAKIFNGKELVKDYQYIEDSPIFQSIEKEWRKAGYSVGDAYQATKDIFNFRDGNWDVREHSVFQGWLKKNGYDGFTTLEEGIENIGIINLDKLKTKSQLKDIWKKAQESTTKKPTPKETPKEKPKETPQEPPKASPTFDEWVKGQELFTGRSQKFDDLTKARGDNLFFTKNKEVAAYYGGTMKNVSKGFVDTTEFVDLSSQAKKAQYVRENFTKQDVDKLFPDIRDGLRNNRIGSTGETLEGFYSRWLKELQNERFTSGEKQKLLLDKLRQQGHKGVILEDATMGIKGDKNSYVVLNKDVVKTRSQLKAEYDKLYKKPQETPKQKQAPKPEVKPKQTTFQSLPKKNLELIETTKKIKSKSGQKMLKKVLGDLEAEVKDMPEYGGMDMKEQAEKALRLAIDDYDYAYRIAMGLENPPKGIKTGSIFNAVKRIAIEKGDIDTIIELATSPEMNSFKKALGQEVKAFDDTMTDDPTKVIEGIIKAQKEQITNADSIIKAEEKKITDLINKKQTTPENFINDILC